MKKLLYIFLASSLLSSCVMYHPHNVDIPLLEEKGDLRIDGSVNMTLPLLDGTGANATVSWAPLNMLGVQASGSISDPHNYHVQASAGTFHGWGKSVLECYIGAGTGHSYYEFSNKNRHIGGQYNLMFSQINFGWNHLADNAIDFGFGFKAGLLSPDWTKESYDDNTQQWIVDFNHTDPHFLIEPQLMFRAGGEHLKFSINVAYSAIANWPTDDNNLNYTRFSFSLGLNYIFKLNGR